MNLWFCAERLSLPAATLKKGDAEGVFPMAKCIAALLMAAHLASCVATSVAGAAVSVTGAVVGATVGAAGAVVDAAIPDGDDDEKKDSDD